MSIFIKQAEENIRLLDSLEKNNKDEFFDWKITIAFYACLHYAKAYLTLYYPDAPVELHHQIRKALQKRAKQDIFDFYVDIQELSNATRYDGITDPSLLHNINKDDYEKRAIPALEAIRSWSTYMVGKKTTKK